MSARPPRRVCVCTGSSCLAGGSSGVLEALRRAVEARQAGGRQDVQLQPTGCHGLCGAGPLVKLPEQGWLYHHVTEQDVEEIVETTLEQAEAVERLLLHDPETERPYRRIDEIPFFSRQHRHVLSRCGEIDPEQIDDYVRCGGYEALEKALAGLSPTALIDALTRSGLAGRGGAGFPTGLKWQLVAEAPGAEKYVVCNSDEGDPGAFKDRSLLEGDPHVVLEGMALAAHAVGACAGLIYVRAEYPLVIRRLDTALRQARQRGLLGPKALGRSDGFDIMVVEGAGAFVCGEETALIAALEGRRPTPRARPPFPAKRGLWDRPTLINNVETFANVPSIVERHAEGSSRAAGPSTRGTKILTLTGAVRNIGLVEVPLGTLLREVVNGIGGGPPGGKRLKAVQIGGPSGGCIPAAQLDVPLDYDRLEELGAMMGSGGLVVLDDETCMVSLARRLLELCVRESCGKCPPCRIGTRVMLNLLERIAQGRGEPGDLERLETLGEHVRASSLCGLGQTAPNPTLSTLRYFRTEYEAHIHDRRCPAGVCRWRHESPLTPPDLRDLPPPLGTP